jgi:hypothetical protein
MLTPAASFGGYVEPTSVFSVQYSVDMSGPARIKESEAEHSA